MIEYIQQKFSHAKDKTIFIFATGLREEWKLWCQNYGCNYHLGTLHTQLKALGIEAPKQVRTNGSNPKTCYRINLHELQRAIQQYLKDNAWSFEFSGELVERGTTIDSGFIAERLHLEK